MQEKVNPLEYDTWSSIKDYTGLQSRAIISTDIVCGTFVELEHTSRTIKTLLSNSVLHANSEYLVKYFLSRNMTSKNRK